VHLHPVPRGFRLGAALSLRFQKRPVNLYLSTGTWRTYRRPSLYGTIGLMSDHRIRLSTEDIALIVAALRSRAAMTKGLRRHRVSRLADRLAEGQRGNPKWLLDELGQTHEDELDEDDLDE
jgi:hypothetical protein